MAWERVFGSKVLGSGLCVGFFSFFSSAVCFFFFFWCFCVFSSFGGVGVFLVGLVCFFCFWGKVLSCDFFFFPPESSFVGFVFVFFFSLFPFYPSLSFFTSLIARLFRSGPWD